MASYRQIHTKIWKDGWFLDLTPYEKLIFIYLFSNERANLIGLYDLPLRVIEFETGVGMPLIKDTLYTLQEAGKVYYEDGWVWVTNLLKYNATNKDSPKIQTHILNTMEEIPDSALKRRLIAYYTPSIPYLYSTKHNRTEQEQEQEHDPEQEQEKEQQQTLDADAVGVLRVFGMNDAAKVRKETRLEDWQIVETVAYAKQEKLGAGWVRNQLRLGNAYRPRAPDNGPRIIMCPTCHQHPCDCEES